MTLIEDERLRRRCAFFGATEEDGEITEFCRLGNDLGKRKHYCLHECKQYRPATPEEGEDDPD